MYINIYICFNKLYTHKHTPMCTYTDSSRKLLAQLGLAQFDLAQADCSRKVLAQAIYTAKQSSRKFAAVLAQAPRAA